MLPIDIPPTAGLPVKLEDFLPSSKSFAQSLTDTLKIPMPILCCSGTAALVVSLKTLSEKSVRDTVIVPAYSCPLVVLAIVHCGLKVQLCDTAPSHFDFDFLKLKALANEKTLAIISTHMGGRLANVQAAKEITKSIGAFVIEDGAWVMGATQHGKPVGIAGDIAFFSLAAGKGLTTYEGGVLFSRSEILHQKLQATAQNLLKPNWQRELQRTLQFLGYSAFYRPHFLPYVYGNDYRRAVQKGDWISALGDWFSADIPLHSLGRWRQSRASNTVKRMMAFYGGTREKAITRIEILKNISGIQILEDQADEQGVWPFIMVLLPSQQIRDVIINKLTPMGLGVSRLFAYALNEYDYLKPYLSSEPMPAAEDFANRMLTISNSPWLADKQFQTIAHEIKNILAHT